jgi:hypothetical protein
MVFGNPRDALLEKVLTILGLPTSREREAAGEDVFKSIWRNDVIDGSLAPLCGIMDLIGSEGTIEDNALLDCEALEVKAAFIITVLVGTNWRKQTRGKTLSDAIVEMLARGVAFVERLPGSTIGPNLDDIETLIIPWRHHAFVPHADDFSQWRKDASNISYMLGQLKVVEEARRTTAAIEVEAVAPRAANAAVKSTPSAGEIMRQHMQKMQTRLDMLEKCLADEKDKKTKEAINRPVVASLNYKAYRPNKVPTYTEGSMLPLRFIQSIEIQSTSYGGDATAKILMFRDSLGHEELAWASDFASEHRWNDRLSLTREDWKELVDAFYSRFAGSRFQRRSAFARVEQLAIKEGGFERLDRYLPRVYSLAIMAGAADDDDELIDRAISGLKDTAMKPALSGLINTQTNWVGFRDAAYKIMNVTSRRTHVITPGTSSHVYAVSTKDQDESIDVDEANSLQKWLKA